MKLTSTPLHATVLEGRFGLELHNLLEARTLPGGLAEEILDEAIAAFDNRVDDRLAPGRGQWQGEFWGKWTLAAVAAQRYTGDRELYQLIHRGVEKLLQTQDENGYIGTYADSAFVTGNCWNIWCRKYTLWGLVDCYELFGEEAILTAARRFMDHLMTEVGPDATNIVDTGNFVGLPSSSILTPLLKLYRHTSHQPYLDYALDIVDQWGRTPGNPPDILNGGLRNTPVHLWFPEAGKWTKAYEFISCVEGLLDLYEITENQDFLTAAINIAANLRDHERVITGGIGYHDKLAGAAFRTDGLNEPCDVVYWQRLLTRLLALTGNPRYADEIERLAYNILLASGNRDGSWALRRTSLCGPHLIAPLHCQLHHHQCCVANLPRGFLQLAQTAVMANPEKNALAINLFIAGQTTFQLATGTVVTIACETSYPKSGSIDYTITLDTPAKFPLLLRIPPWCHQASLLINDAEHELSAPGTYTEIHREWKPGDRLSLNLEIRPRLVHFKGDIPHHAVMHGPVVLARSELIDNGDIHAPVAFQISDDGRLSSETITAPEGVWLAFQVKTADGGSISLCDYASTGKDHDKPTDPEDWKGMIENHTDSDLRTWLPIQ